MNIRETQDVRSFIRPAVPSGPTFTNATHSFASSFTDAQIRTDPANVGTSHRQAGVAAADAALRLRLLLRLLLLLLVLVLVAAAQARLRQVGRYGKSATARQG